MWENRISSHFNKELVETNLRHDAKKDQRFVLYWMQQSQRVIYNHALYYAINEANRLKMPLVVFFSVVNSYPDANERHYMFMMEGLVEVEQQLKALGINFVIALGSPEQTIRELLDDTYLLVMDKGYMKLQRNWRSEVASIAEMSDVLGCVEIESDLVIPIEMASDKEEYMARTIRPKIERQLYRVEQQLVLPELHNKTPIEIQHSSELSLKDYTAWIQDLPINHTIKKSNYFTGGRSHGIKLLDNFILDKLEDYGACNSPEFDCSSKLSLYLHFGQLSALEIFHRLNTQQQFNESKQKFLEQLIIRRELAYNYCYYRNDYDQFQSMTNSWAYITMALHCHDQRDYVYSKEALIGCNTHDPYFNAAMREMILTGFMHGYMRMYWCKKIIEWSITHEEAYQVALELNNTYFIDGRDPNSYTGVGWCFGLHDQGFKERPVFGKLRYMSEDGLKRKFNMDAYIQRVNELT
jgi:deoxyribodipyrimidine photo-lyase